MQLDEDCIAKKKKKIYDREYANIEKLPLGKKFL